MDKKEICEVKKIVLKIDDKEISLSIEQAKKLKGLLSDMFGKEVVVKEEHHHHYDRWYFEPYKITWNTQPAFQYDSKLQVMCCDLNK